MIPNAVDYPVFEANQVLTNEPLNSLRAYLDEQNRLTRATLHGIGVVCGLAVNVADTGKTITISKGYGVTSEGYLAIVGNEDFVADRYRDYKVPAEDGYGLLSKKVTGDNENKYPLLELLNPGHDDYDEGTALTPAVLQGKVVLLFVEMPEENLKNCSPASCDDKGKNVEITLRKLLIAESDLALLNKEIADNIAAAKATGDFFPDLTARLNLPDLRLPRLDVPASNMVDAQTIFAAYRKILSPKILNPLFTRTGTALDEAYAAFKPVLSPLPANNFLSEQLKKIRAQYDDVTKNTNVIFSQYFYDFLDDVLQAYEEFRWKAVEFMALCIPPEALFPRHLELGETGEGNFAGKKVHRHYFRPSPALAEQKKLGEEVAQLFQRLRLMVEFFEAPKMPGADMPIPNTVKIIPSRLGDVKLSKKAIPYYYQPGSLLKAWNFQNTRTGRPSLNHGYHVDTQYHRFPTANPLEYDTERFNFYRIEGHVGFDWRKVLQDLLDKIRKYRLPFDVIALNAHPATVTADVLKDPLVSRCLTNDLQVIFDAWSKELECMMGEKLKALTDLKLPGKLARAPRPGAVTTFLSPSFSLVSAQPKVNVLTSVVTTEGTLGNILAAAVEKTETSPTPTASKPSSTSLEIRDNATALLKADPEVSKLSVTDYDVAIGKRLDVITALVDFTNAIPASASDLKYETVSSRYQNLVTALTDYRDILVAYIPPVENPVITPVQKDQTLKELQALLNNCLIKRLEELGAELERRKKQVEELIFFSKYVRRHPGIEHKAGVPKGGTFILVFQEVPTQITLPGKGSFTTGTLTGEIKPAATTTSIGSATGNILANLSKLSLSAKDRLILTSTLSTAGITLPDNILTNLGTITVGGAVQDSFKVPERVVIADFFLPYRCCSDCPPVQFVLPASRPIFTMKEECTDPNGEAIVNFEFTYATPPCEVKIDDKDFIPLVNNRIRLSIGKHLIVVRDAEGGTSLPQEIEIFPRLLLELGTPVCDANNQFYTVQVKAIGGKLPLFVDGTEVVAAPDPTGNPGVHFITVGPLPTGVPTKVKISDSSVCDPQVVDFEHTCIPFVTKPDEVQTAHNTPVTINVLANDTGSGLVVTNATLPSPSLGTVVVNADFTITYTPRPEVENRAVEITYTVANDAGDTKTEKVTVHVGKRPCDLPCDGKAVKCGYYFWVQPVIEGQKLHGYQAAISQLEIDGKNLLANAQPPSIDATAAELSANLSGVIEKWLKRINEFVTENIGDGIWILKHEPKAVDPFATLRIERFVCHKFIFEVKGVIVINDVNNEFRITYTESGTVAEWNIQGRIVNYKLPTFDCVDLDKCNPAAGPRPRCEGPAFGVDFKFNIQPGGGNNRRVVFTGLITGIVAPQDINWYWEFQDGTAADLNAQEQLVTFRNLEQTNFTKRVKVVAIDSKGCVAMKTAQINLGLR